MAVWEIRVTGLVQGVGFRWFVKRLADELGVSGYVRNKADGSVFILASAESEVLEHYVACVRADHFRAIVKDAEVTILDHTKEYYDFEIR